MGAVPPDGRRAEAERGRAGNPGDVRDGAQTVVFKVSLPNERNPFGRGGLWTFRCLCTL